MKNPFIAFLLGFFPGGGLLYLGKVRGLFYMGVVFGIPISTFIFGFLAYDTAFIVLGFAAAILMYIVSLVDTIVTAAKLTKPNDVDEEAVKTSNMESERFFTTVLSIVPGLGHFQLGLMNRGLTFLASFFGLGAMILFATLLSGREVFIVFLIVLPVIWMYSLFDAMNQLNKKRKGEELIDQSILEDLEAQRETGKKSKVIATLLSVFPGAGHLYLGLQRRGLQFMAAFLFSIYILDVLHLGVFLFLVPIIWFYSFFDSLQKASQVGKEQLQDEPIIAYLMNHQKWIGIGLIALGVYYLLSSVLIPALGPILNKYFSIDIDVMYWFDRYFQVIVVCVLLIGGGIKLMLGSKKSDTEVSE